MEAPNNFGRRGLLDLPVSLPSIPILNPLITPLLGGSTPTPTPGNNIPNVTPLPQPVPTQLAPTPSLGQSNGYVPANGGGGGGSTPTTTNPGSGNTNVPNQNPNASPNSPTPTTPNPDSHPSNPTPNSGSPGSNPSNFSNSPPTSNPPSSQSSVIPKNGAVQLPGSTQQNYGGSDSQEDAVFTTISGVRTEVTRRPHSTNGKAGDPTGGGGDGPTGGGGDGVNPSGGGGLGHGIIAVIVISIVLALALLVFFLRKRMRERRAARHVRWLSGGESGRRSTLRSSFGDLRADTFSSNSEDYHDNTSDKRHSGPFSDSMAVPPLTLASANPPTPQMSQVTNREITPPAAAVLSSGKRSTCNSQFSIGTSESGGSDESGSQWLEFPLDVRFDDNGRLDLADQWCLPSPISVRPFTPTESWSFPQPPTSRIGSKVYSRELRGLVDLNPFADPVPQSSEPPASLLEAVTKTFELEGTDESVVEIGDEVPVFEVF